MPVVNHSSNLEEVETGLEERSKQKVGQDAVGIFGFHGFLGSGEVVASSEREYYPAVHLLVSDIKEDSHMCISKYKGLKGRPV